MQTEDTIVSKLLSLRFHQFSEADRQGLSGNVKGNGVRSCVSEAARIYLDTAVARGMAEAGHLASIADWLSSFGPAMDQDIVRDYRAVVRELTLHAAFPRAGDAGRALAV